MGHGLAPDRGSFRDPTNRVYDDGERVLRALDVVAVSDFEALTATDFFGQEQDAGRIIATTRLQQPPDTLSDEWTAALEHERIPVISYPYEWTFGMLRDAALLQIDLSLAALAEGLITKDATPYNVQFVGHRPVHIDVGSFEILSPGQPWFGYRQFCEQFLFPLVLTDRRGLTHQQAMRGSLRGISPADCAACLRFRDRLHPALFVHVTLNARADRRRRAEAPDKVRAELKAAGYGPQIIEAQLRRLRKLVAKLKWEQGESVWSDYSDRSHYTDEDLEQKAQFVQSVASQRHRRQVLDLGANDGFFSRLVLPTADYVVAVDHDPLVIERLYRELRDQDESRILPLVCDLADPPGGVGWRGRERPSFVERVEPDLVLCLALIHHLAITESIPLEEIVSFLASFRSEVILEFPLEKDPMVDLLMRQKKDQEVTAERYTKPRLDAALDGQFDVALYREMGTRVLYHLQPR